MALSKQWQVCYGRLLILTLPGKFAPGKICDDARGAWKGYVLINSVGNWKSAVLLSKCWNLQQQSQFDNEHLWPYDCAPMSPGTVPQQLELRKLAALGTEIAGDIPLPELPRFASMLVNDSGGANIRFELGLDENRRPIMAGKIHTSVQVECQRCLQALDLVLDADVNLVFVWSEREFQSITGNRDPLVLGDDRLDLYAVVEEELLLALPFINCHDQGQCSAADYAAGEAENDSAQEPRQNPFEVLKQLKRKDQEN